MVPDYEERYEREQHEEKEDDGTPREAHEHRNLGLEAGVEEPLRENLQLRRLVVIELERINLASGHQLEVVVRPAAVGIFERLKLLDFAFFRLRKVVFSASAQIPFSPP